MYFLQINIECFHCLRIASLPTTSIYFGRRLIGRCGSKSQYSSLEENLHHWCHLRVSCHCDSAEAFACLSIGHACYYNVYASPRGSLAAVGNNGFLKWLESQSGLFIVMGWQCELERRDGDK